MLKLYRTLEGVTEYWEAWATATEITTHWGKLGDEGESREQAFEAGVNPNQTIEREAKPLRAAGFKPLKRTEWRSIVIQYKVLGNTADHDRRTKIEELMNERLGWTGLGHCDGGDMGAGTMNIFLKVADAEIAESVIVQELKTQGFLDGAVIADGSGGETEVLWPRSFKGKFSLI
jgi:predicted DNA-binding WGR domain protein